MKNIIKSMALAVFICVLTSGLYQGFHQNNARAAVTAGNYIALGDSIAAGYGLADASAQGYVAQLGTMLNCTNTINLGISGMNSSQLLDALKTPEVQKVLGGSSIITVSIGSNDILGPFTAYVAQAFGTPSLGQIGETLMNSDQTVLYAKIASLGKLISEDASSISGMKAGAAKFAMNFPAIISILRSSAPGAEIYVNNLYNPYRGLSLASLNLGDVTERYISAINSTVFSSISLDYNLVDVYSVFNTTEGLVNADANTFNYDPHPNVAGHNVITNAYLGVLGSRKSTRLKSLAELMSQIDMSAVNGMLSSQASTLSASAPSGAAAKVIIKSAFKRKSSSKAKVILKKIDGVTGYQIKLSTSRTFKDNIKSRFDKKISVTVNKLKKNVTYYVKARAYVIVAGDRKYGSWSKVKKLISGK